MAVGEKVTADSADCTFVGSNISSSPLSFVS